MLTAIIIIILFLTLIGSIIYDRKLVKTEKIDAVFGNPERTNGGFHWVIAGSCTILLLWFYFSWDLARSFHPKSANELCQVAKLRESVLGINYIFPINERTLKSTAFIERESKNIQLISSEIDKAAINRSQKNQMIGFLDDVTDIIGLLSDDSNLSPNIQTEIESIASRIAALTKEFSKESFGKKTEPTELQEEIELLSKQASWGATGMEIPPLAETDKGRKFQEASARMNVIVEDFFKIKNNNSLFNKTTDDLTARIKLYKAKLTDDQESEKKLLRKISKSLGRVMRSNIFPSSTLDGLEFAVVEFDAVQNAEQGTLRIVDMLLFPSGTIVASGETCSEQGSGRWLPKPTDTLKIFVQLLHPSEGYKNYPMLWYEMVEINYIIGSIIPDWVADILPGKYPVHDTNGKIIPNFKKITLNIAQGKFNAFSIPIPSGHIWDSFLRVFLGLSLGVIAGVPLGLFMGLSRFAKGYFDPVIELYRPVPPLAWAPLIITVFGIDNSGKVFLLFMVSFAIMIVSARAGASGTQLSKIHAAHSLGASKWQILRQVIFPNSLPEILTGIRVAVGVCWGTLVAAEFLAGTTGIGFVENVARKYMQYEHIWITIFVMGMLGMLFDLAMRALIRKTIPWRGKG